MALTSRLITIPLPFTPIHYCVSESTWANGISIPKVIEFEVKRQQGLISEGKKIAKEVRKAEPDFSTSFLRPLPGSARMYPETDVLPVRIASDHIFHLRENLPKLGYRSRIEVMTPLIPGLSAGGKMSSSDKGSKIDLIEPEQEVKKKLNSAYCPEGIAEGNGVLAFCRYVLMVIKKDKNEEFVIKRPDKFGGNVSYKDYDVLESDFINKKLHPMDLKSALADEINKLLLPIRNQMKGKEELINKAYPD